MRQMPPQFQRKAHKLILLLVLILMTGCQTLLQPPTPPTQEDIQHWVSKGLYNKALEGIKQQTNPSRFHDTVSTINQAIKAEVSKTLTQVEQETAQQHWYSARILIKNTQQNMPPQSELSSALKQTNIAEQYQRKVYASDEAIMRAAWISSSIVLQQHNIDDEGEGLLNTYRLQQLREDESNLIRDLIRYSQDALQTQDMEKALACYQAASALSNNTESSNQLETLFLKIQEQQKRPLLEQLHAAKEVNDFLALRNAANALNELTLDDTTQAELTEVTDWLNIQSEQLSQQGDKFYSKGQLLEANAVWELALQINNNNKAVEEKLARVIKVLKNLKHLRSHSVPN